MAKIKKATFDCPMCGRTVEMTTVAEPVVLSRTSVDWEVSIDTEPLRDHLARHVNNGESADALA